MRSISRSASGEFVTLLGPSGSGKTTTLMMVAGFTAPTEGEIAIDGRPITGMAPEHRNIGVVFQNYALFPHMTVFDNVAFPLKMRRQPSAEIRARVGRALDMVHLDGLGERLPRQLSGGQQQRVALARALVFDPGLLLMDEPLGALDRNLREQMKIEIKRIHTRRRRDGALRHARPGRGAHDVRPRRADEPGPDRSARLGGGSLRAAGHALRRGVHRRVESDRRPRRVRRDGDAVLVLDGGVRLTLAERPARRLAVRSSCTLMVRPEKITLGPAGRPSAGLDGAVEEVIYVGEFTRYRVRVAPAVVINVKVANTHAASRAKPGDHVRLWWAAADASYLDLARE